MYTQYVKSCGGWYDPLPPPQHIIYICDNVNCLSTSLLQEVSAPKEGKVSPSPPPPLTGIAWHTDKYYGTPLELSDERLGKLADWVTHHNITVVKVGMKVMVTVIMFLCVIAGLHL